MSVDLRSRIVKNSIIVYFRLIVTTILGLIISRVVLKTLGASDYGLYNVVGGFIALFSVIAASMSSTTVRFLNIELGKPDGNPNKIFNVCNIIHIILAIFVLLIGEVFGVYYINNYLNVPAEKLSDAMFVFQVSTIVACVGIINVPYQSIFVAKERFWPIALTDIFNSVLKLLLVLILSISECNVLRWYAIIMSLTTFVSFAVYHYFAYRYWHDLIKWNLYKEFKEYKEIFIFNNYNLLGSVALVGRTQGANMLMNFFFGTVVNAAYGIARTIQSLVEVFTNNVDAAAAPQIIQSVGRSDVNHSISLACKVCKMCQLVSLLIIFPLFVETEFLLRIWLGEVPAYSVQFAQLLMLSVFVASTGGGLLKLKDAMGKIKWFMISFSFWNLITLPVGYILFRLGYAPCSILCLCIISDLLSRITQLLLMKIIYRMNVGQFCINAYIRPLFVFFIMMGYAIIYHNVFLFTSNFLSILGIFVTGVVGIIIVLYIGMASDERVMICSMIKNKISHECVKEV